MKRGFTKHSLRFTVLATAALLLGGCGMAQDGALIRAHNAVAVGRYNFALARLADAEAYKAAPPTQDAQIAYLRARSYEGLQRWAEAVGSYQYLIAKHPDSQYAFQARERLKVLTPRGPVLGLSRARR